MKWPEIMGGTDKTFNNLSRFPCQLKLNGDAISNFFRHIQKIVSSV